MQKLLLTNLEAMPADELNTLFADVFCLDHGNYAGGEHTNVLLNLVLEHAIRLEIDKTVTTGALLYQVQLIPRTSRRLFDKLRTIYYQGLQIPCDDDALFWNTTVTMRGASLDATIMRCLLKLAFTDAFRRG